MRERESPGNGSGAGVLARFKNPFEVSDRAGQPFIELHLWIPAELIPGVTDIRTALSWIVLRQRLELWSVNP